MTIITINVSRMHENVSLSECNKLEMILNCYSIFFVQI